MDIIGGAVQTLLHDPCGVAAHDASGSRGTALRGPGEVPSHDVGGNGATIGLDPAPPVEVPAQDVGGNGVCILLCPSGVVAVLVGGTCVDANAPICAFA